MVSKTILLEGLSKPRDAKQWSLRWMFDPTLTLVLYSYILWQVIFITTNDFADQFPLPDQDTFSR